MIVQGRVRVNGERVKELGTRVDPDRDRIEVDGREILQNPVRWILLNKPRGTVTTRRDPQGRPTVYSLLASTDESLRYAGRLDQDTEGLLLFTNDGDLLHALTHPSARIAREYRAEVGGVPTVAVLAALEAGIELEDGLARAEKVRILEIVADGRGAVLTLVLREGRKREVRRMFEAVGYSVRRLSRVAFGPIRLGSEAPGQSRALTEQEVNSLRNEVMPPTGRTA
jgi:pseudouridine synthase